MGIGFYVGSVFFPQALEDVIPLSSGFYSFCWKFCYQCLWCSLEGNVIYFPLEALQIFSLSSIVSSFTIM